MPEPTQPKRERNSNGPSQQRRDYGKLRAVHSVSWSEVSAEAIIAAISRITTAGAAIMFGRTSDGGAYSITVLDGSERIREWPHTSDECEKTLSWLYEMFAND